MKESELEDDQLIRVMEKIENYILGRLTQDEIDDLWGVFLIQIKFDSNWWKLHYKKT